MGELPRVVREARQARLAQLHLPADFDCGGYSFNSVCGEPTEPEQVDRAFASQVAAIKHTILTGEGLSCKHMEAPVQKLHGTLAPNQVLCLPQAENVAA
jgi:hypothetical protein